MVIVWTFILFVLPSLLKFLFGFLGIGVLAFVAFDLLIDDLTAQIFSNFNNVATDALLILQIANVDTAISIILASYTAGSAIHVVIAGTKRFRY